MALTTKSWLLSLTLREVCTDRKLELGNVKACFLQVGEDCPKLQECGEPWLGDRLAAFPAALTHGKIHDTFSRNPQAVAGRKWRCSPDPSDSSDVSYRYFRFGMQWCGPGGEAMEPNPITEHGLGSGPWQNAGRGGAASDT